MARFLLPVLVAAVCVTATKADEKADLARFQGTWVVTKVVRNGTEAPDVVRDALRVTVTGRSLTIRSAENVPTVIQAEITLNPSVTPAQIDFRTSGMGKQTALFGIYKIDGDTIRLCWTTDGGPWPDGFAAPAGSKAVYFELKKAVK